MVLQLEKYSVKVVKMPVIQRIVKAKTRRGKKILLRKEPQLIEGIKRTLFFHGRKSSEKVRSLMKDLYNLKKPDGCVLKQKNDITIFENVTPVETFCKKNETPLFVMGSHTKKRPDNLVIGRMFDESLLDMFEFGIENYVGFTNFNNEKITLGSKPCLIFNGSLWEQTDEMKQLKTMFVDLFHREHVDAVRLQGIEHSMSFTACENGKILLRSYKIAFKKSGSSTPRVEIEEIGPRIDLTMRRTKLPTEDLLKQAMRKPKELTVTKKKNISQDGLGNTHGRIHVGKQVIKGKLQIRKMKGLRNKETTKGKSKETTKGKS